MQHPLWYMKPIHILLRLIGVKHIVLGSAGHEGRKAADELVKYVRAGYSTVLIPDGPAGPPRVLKRGVLHLAAQSGVAIVPLRFSASPTVSVRSWDRKQIAIPFSKICIDVGSPVFVSPNELENAGATLTEALG